MEEREKPPLEAETPTEKKRWLTNIHSVLALFLAAAVAALVCFCCMQSRELDKDVGRIGGVKQELALCRMELKAAKRETRRGYWERFRMAVRVAAAEKEAEFWSSRAALVTRYGERYHTWNCSVLREDTVFSVLSIEAAEAQGYTPCGLCRPDGK